MALYGTVPSFLDPGIPIEAGNPENWEPLWNWEDDHAMATPSPSSFVRVTLKRGRTTAAWSAVRWGTLRPTNVSPKYIE